MQEWFTDGLRDWDISRDAPYFGFRIPGTEDKYFYVWVDAPIGYMASFRELCEREGLDFDAWWEPDSTTGSTILLARILSISTRFSGRRC